MSFGYARLSIVLEEMRWASSRFRLEELHGLQVEEKGSNSRQWKVVGLDASRVSNIDVEGREQSREY
jgi:hypothetical protein